MTSDFTGKHIVITGAPGGLGTTVVRDLLDRGATCHLPFFLGEIPADVPWAKHERAVITCGVDLSSEAAVQALYRGVPELWASIHLAGGFTMGPIAETSLADVDRMLAMNVRTTFLCCREATIAMRKHPGGGRILNVSARPAVRPGGGLSAYTMSKAAVAALTQELAAELISERILVNAVLPSIIDTPANRAAMPDADHDSWPKPAQLAETIAFLTSPANSLTSGALVPVYGAA